MNKKIWPNHIIQKKVDNEKIVMLTAYEFLTAKILEEIEVDIILVGDSVGNVFSGLKNTMPVTMDQMIYHCQAVSRAANKALLVADMPFMSYQVSNEQAKLNAGRLIKESGAQAVKIEIQNSNISYVKEIIDAGIPVMGHIGFTPQNAYQLGGNRIQGKTEEDAQRIMNLAKELEAAGCFAVLLEMVPTELAKKVTKIISIPTIGIGAGPYCDGQVLVTQDLLGLNNGFTPKFVKKYCDLNEIMKKALTEYKNDVLNGSFPDNSQSF
jgi:3-methyl-2-oxobutanoate hydroxymethyltransferase